MHTLLEIDGIEYLDSIPLFQKNISAFHHNGAFGVCNNVGTVTLEKIGLQPKSSLTGTRTANNQHVFIPGILGIRRTVGHHQPLRLRQDDVVLKFGSDKGCNILSCAP